ncbi:MAG: TIGR02710 family CRISPR-associated CARF protein [Bacillota bacterium]
MSRLALVLILGGPPELLAKVIDRFRPEMVCYLISEEGIRRMGELMKMINHHPAIARKIVVTDYEDLLACYEAANRCLEVTRKEGFAVKDTIVDLSGGIPSMVAGMVAAGAPWGYKFHALKDPTKRREALYPLFRKEEEAFLHEKFAKKMFLAELKQAALLFNQAQFTAARMLFEDLLPRVESPQSFFVKALAAIARGYEAWDLFAYPRAREEMAKGVAALDWYYAVRADRWEADEDTVLTVFTKAIKENMDFLAALTVDDPDEERGLRRRVIDLLAHAERRVAVGAYEDALTRLYRAAELVLKKVLARREDKDSSWQEKIPTGLREEFARKYGEGDGRLRLPVPAAYRLLAAVHDPVGKHLARNPQALEVMEAYWDPLLRETRAVDAEAVKAMAAFLRELFAIKEEEIPRPPKLVI